MPEKYQPLEQHGDYRNSLDEEVCDTEAPRELSSFRKCLVRISSMQPLIIASLCLALGLVIYREKSNFHSRCVKSLHTPSPIIDAGVIDEYSTLYLNGTLNFKDKWAGTPNAARDQKWRDIIYEAEADSWIPISDDAVRQMGKDPKSVTRVPPQYREQYGDGAIVVLEFAHHLHCLDLVRRYTYYDYYNELQDEPAFGNPPHILRVHIDHCIDMIRQFLMCNADPGLITHFWIEGRPTPYPDFSMQKQCKNPYEILKWGKEHAIPNFKPVHPSPHEAVFPWDPEIL